MAINAFFSIHLVDIGAESALVGASWAIGALVEIPVMLGYPCWAAVSAFDIERLLLVGASAFLCEPSPCWSCRTRYSRPPPWPCTASASRWCGLGGVVYVSRHAPPGTAATTQGVLGATVFGVAAILGPGVGGLLAGWLGLQGMFTVATIGCGLAVLALAWALRR